jgi:hypothetical protein
MFDLNYNDVGFVPAVAVFKSKSDDKASAEEIKKTQEEVKALSKNVEEQSAAVSKNSDNIATNTTAIANETAAREEAVEGLNVKIDGIPTFETEVVDELPAEGRPGTIYLVKDEGKDTYSEYLYAGGAWEKLGSDVNLSDYATKEELAEAVAPLAVKSAVDTLIDQEAAAREELAKPIYTRVVTVHGAAAKVSGYQASSTALLYADGGRATRASIFGEAGAEWAIPEEHSSRTAELLNSARAASGFSWGELIARTGGLSGNPQDVTVPVTYAPTIYAGNASGLAEVLKQDKKELAKLMRDVMRDDRLMAAVSAY